MKIIKNAQNSTEISQSNFPIWLSQQILKSTNNFKIPLDLTQNDLEILSKWAYETSPDLSKINLAEAYEFALEWHKKEISQKYSVNRAKQRALKEPQPVINKAKLMKTKITKTANKTDERMPDGNSLALYVQTLKQYLRDNPNIPEEYVDLINNLPAARKVKQDFSLQECKVLYQTLEYLWERITKQRIIPEKEVFAAPESLSGNYLMIANGVLLNGINTYDIIKRNSALLCSLLDIGGMTMQEHLSRKPNDLVRFIIKCGALRLFITKDKRAYFQCNQDVYGAWARNKIRKLDFKKKVVKIIDLRAPYNGWQSGISVLL